MGFRMSYSTKSRLRPMLTQVHPELTSFTLTYTKSACFYVGYNRISLLNPARSTVFNHIYPELPTLHPVYPKLTSFFLVHPLLTSFYLV